MGEEEGGLVLVDTKSFKSYGATSSNARLPPNPYGMDDESGGASQAQPLIDSSSSGGGGASVSGNGASPVRGKGRGGGAAAVPASVLDASGIDRALFVVALKKNRDRIRHCRTVPFSVCTYFMFIAALLAHVRVGTSYDFETSLIASVPPPANPDTWFYYMKHGFFDAVLPQDPADPSMWGRVNGNGLIIGGVRVLTQRRAAGTCPLPAGKLRDAYSAACALEGSNSLDAFGDAAIAEAAGVGSAFVATTVAGDSAGPRFQFVLDTTLNRTQLEALIDGLRDAGWIDNRTASVDVQFAVLNGEAGLFGRVAVGVAYALGGVHSSATTSTSIDVDPYYGTRAWLALLDVLLLLYWLYLLAGTLRRVRETLLHRGPVAAPSWGSRVSVLLSYWRLLDMTTTVSMLVTFCVWWTLLSRLADIRATFDGGAVVVEQAIFNAATVYASFKVAAVVTLAALTLRLFKYFAYQQRLAVISEALSRGFGDAAHFLLLFGILVIFFGVWGFFMFGSQSYYWNTPENAVMATAKMFMYDYDIDSMRLSFPVMSDVFYIAFMFMMANLMLWLFLAIFFDTYTEVRAESHRGPSAAKELIEVLVSAGDWAPRFLPANGCGGCCCRGKAKGTGRAAAARDDATLAEVLYEATKGSLRLDARITQLSLVHALGLTDAAAAKLIADAAAASTRFQAAGDPDHQD